MASIRYPGVSFVMPAAVATEPDGKIVLVGTVWATAPPDGDPNDPPTSWTVARFNADGTLDSSFGPDRTGEETFSLDHNSLATNVLIQADGKIIVAGTRAAVLTVVRLNLDGSVDASFNGGFTSYDGLGSWHRFYGWAGAMWFAGDGSIVVAGTSANDYPQRIIATLHLHASDGTPDESFAPGGYTAVDLWQVSGAVCGDYDLLGIGPLGGGGGAVAYLQSGQSSILRVQTDANGQLVSIRSLDGIMGNGDQYGYSPYLLHVAADGSVYVAAGSEDDSLPAIIQHFDSGGTLDPNFGTNGTMTVPMILVSKIQEMSDGSVLVVGGNSNWDAIIARLLPDGSSAPLVAGGQPIDDTEHIWWPSVVQPQADGSILLAQNAGNGLDLLKLLGDGTLPPPAVFDASSSGANGGGAEDSGGSGDPLGGATLALNGDDDGESTDSSDQSMFDLPSGFSVFNPDGTHGLLDDGADAAFA